MRDAVSKLFERYERETNAALAGAPDVAALSALYADAFVGASPAGVMSGGKDEAFAEALLAGLDRQRAIGARRMEVRDLRVEPIDALHALARVAWRATYEVRGAETAIDFTNVYLARVDDAGARVFGWITGDETAELRRHGVID